ncbi:MAG: RNA polymerase sigma factor [Ilumatobacteraceae bacterium]
MSEPTTRNDPDVLATTVIAAQAGDAVALEQLVLAVRDRVYRLALRMTARPPDAEDATQEILIRVITRLSTFRSDAAFTTWVHRVAVSHLLDRAKNCVERMEMTFDAFANDLLDGLSNTPSHAPDAAILEREVQLACTHALLTCLDREHRIAYILGEILGVDSDDGGYICEVAPATYRKRLSRARVRVREFLTANCGLVAPSASCHCSKRVDTAVQLGRIDPHRLEFTDTTTRVNEELIRFHDAATLLRALPPATVPTSVIEAITAMIRDSTAADPADRRLRVPR